MEVCYVVNNLVFGRHCRRYSRKQQAHNSFYISFLYSFLPNLTYHLTEGKNDNSPKMQNSFLDICWEYDIKCDIIMSIESDINKICSTKNVRFSQLAAICDRCFKGPRTTWGSHFIYKTPWRGDPRINIQRRKGGRVASYQVKQVIKALEKLRDEYGKR